MKQYLLSVYHPEGSIPEPVAAALDRSGNAAERAYLAARLAEQRRGEPRQCRPRGDDPPGASR
jgi:hypothetical protein